MFKRLERWLDRYEDTQIVLACITLMGISVLLMLLAMAFHASICGVCN